MIRRYTPEDESQLFSLIEREGEAWKDYYQGEGKAKYQKSLSNSIVYIAIEDGTLCGYVRCHDNDGFGIFIYDLLVDKEYRGKEYGRLMMEKVAHDHPNDTVYVLSDVDTYYAKLGYEKAGTVFIVK